MILRLYLFSFSLLIISCTQKNKTINEAQQTKSEESYDTICYMLNGSQRWNDSTDGLCLLLPKGAELNSIEPQLVARLASYVPSKTEKTIKGIAQSFLASAKVFHEKYPASQLHFNWKIKVALSPIKGTAYQQCEADGLLNHQTAINYAQAFRFIVSQGQTFEKELFADTLSLKKAILSAIKQQYHIKNNENMIDNGFYIADNEIYPSTEYTFDGENLTFWYPPLTLMPADKGFIKIKMPYKKAPNANA